MKTKQLVGARIKSIRMKKGLTQEKLAEKIGISPKYLSSIERGLENPTLDTILNIVKKLRVPLDDIFSTVDIENPKKRKALINKLLDEADDEQLKLAYKVLVAIIR